MTLVYVSDWSDEDSATQYFNAYEKVLRAKWKEIEVTSEDAARFTGKSEDGYFAVVRDGAHILSQEGFNAPPLQIAAAASR